MPDLLDPGLHAASDSRRAAALTASGWSGSSENESATPRARQGRCRRSAALAASSSTAAVPGQGPQVVTAVADGDRPGDLGAPGGRRRADRHQVLEDRDPGRDGCQGAHGPRVGDHERVVGGRRLERWPILGRLGGGDLRLGLGRAVTSAAGAVSGSARRRLGWISEGHAVKQ